jgi:Uma2 family endonuclease
MSTLTPPIRLTPEDVERASERDQKRYELINGELREKNVGTLALFVATRISERFNATYYPDLSFAAVEVMTYCFGRDDHGREPDVAFVWLRRLPGGRIPKGDLQIAPDVAVEVLSPGNTGIEIDDKLDEYLAAGVPMVWIVNPDRMTIRVYRADGTMRVFRAPDVIENEPLLPGFRMTVGEVFPPQPQA